MISMKSFDERKSREASLPCLGHLEEFHVAADATALDRDVQPVGRILGSKAAALPCKAPVRAGGPCDRVGLFGQECVRFERRMQRVAEKRLRACQRFGSLQTSAGRRLLDLVRVTDDAPARVHANPELFLLQRPEKPHVPIPDAHCGRHQVIGLFESHLALEVSLLIVVYIENDARLVAPERRACASANARGLQASAAVRVTLKSTDASGKARKKYR